MPLRVLGYDGAEYRAQLLADNDAKSRYPVVTLVLYYGYNGHWDKPLSLKERLDIPPEFDEFVNDYKINLFEIAYLTRKQVEMFQSDFRIVADDIKKSDAYQSGFLEGTTPAYEAYMRLKKNLAASIK